MFKMATILLLSLLAAISNCVANEDLFIVNPFHSRAQDRTSSDDDLFVVVAAAAPTSEEGRKSFIPTDNSKSGEPGFKLLRKEDLEDDIVVVAASEDDEGNRDGKVFIPTDDSKPGQPGFKLLRKEDIEDFEVIEADEEGRSLQDDIPRDTSGPDQAGFRLPLPDDDTELDDIVVIEAAGDGEEGRTLDDIPRDTSGADEAGFRLPLPHELNEQKVIVAILHESESRVPKALDRVDYEIIEFGDDDDEEENDCFAEREPGTCLNTYEAYFYDSTHNKCHFFIYSGCGGNSNRFSSEAECETRCKDAKKGDKGQVPCGTSAPVCTEGCVLAKPDGEACLKCVCKKEDTSICFQPARPGLCKAALVYWYYNADEQQCKTFLYGGCEAGSSPNKFKTKALCETSCSGLA